jgi:hypothetical protein
VSRRAGGIVMRGEFDSLGSSHMVWSLADVVKINAKVFLGSLDVLVQYHFVGQFGGQGAESPQASDSLKRQVQQLLDEMSDPSFAMCRASAERMIENLNRGVPPAQIVHDATDLRGRLLDHFERSFVLALSDAEKRRFAPDAPLFGADVDERFPRASFDVAEAGKCLALSRDTAAVFHLMRVMEVGLFATTRALGIPDPIKPAQRNWGTMLRAVRDEIGRRPIGSWDDRAFFDGLFVSLEAVRSAWRNGTMHVDRTYTNDEAEDVFAAVRRFMLTLAARLDEDGRPAA